MCGRFSFRARLNAALQELAVETQGGEFDNYLPRFNICPTTQIPVIRQTNGKREAVSLRWGFIPSWAKDAKLNPINAVSETVAEKPMFKSAIKRRRCLIPADGFYEWQRIPEKVKGSPPFLFEVLGGKVFCFGGIWETWEKGDVPIQSCAMLTTGPNELMAPIHHRMPVILSPSDYDAWLDPTMNDPAKLTYMYEPFPASDMTMKLASAYTNKAGNEGPECLDAHLNS